MSVRRRERVGGEERHAGEAGMRGRDEGNKIREQEGGEEEREEREAVITSVMEGLMP